MFTGIVEEMGVIRSIRRGARSAVLSIGAETVLSDLKLGDSVAVNGVCLTATTVDGGGFTADVMHETLRRSSLGALIPGSPVNLERAMAADGRFGGHIVSGHIDGISLTVATVAADRFSVSVIPHTAAVTVLGRKGPGDIVNLETDLIGKYVEKLLRPTADSAPRNSSISLEFLTENGF